MERFIYFHTENATDLKNPRQLKKYSSTEETDGNFIFIYLLQLEKCVARQQTQTQVSDSKQALNTMEYPFGKYDRHMVTHSCSWLMNVFVSADFELFKF